MKKFLMNYLQVPRSYHYLLRLLVIYFAIQSLIRLLFVIENPPGFIDIVGVFFYGFLWDTFAWLFLSLPLLILSAFVPAKFIIRFDRSLAGKAVTFFLSCILIFVGFCEFNFWKEFHSRFNFIAVDYLIYTNEVLANIRESFPMDWILSGVSLLALGFTFFAARIRFPEGDKLLLRKGVSLTLFGVLSPLLFLYGIGPSLEIHEEDFHEDQLSRNGWVEFVRAFRSNKIDYKSFYSVISDQKAESLVASSKVPFSGINHPYKKKPNVVLIVVESLGAKFIGPLGGQKETTPFLNKLADESEFYENFYSTGTRTVRGLEAINLSLPPTPGYSVVKRPNHKNLYSLGNTFRSNGYDPIFMYGGRGFFDNMNSFFTGNGFSVIDQPDFSSKETTFKNAWGVCDEDLFAKAIQVMDKRDIDETKPTVLFLLTTSNHRPFTYPSGKIDIPSGESRVGAVKYTDYAIGKFINESLKKDWAKDTLFVILADHSTEGRGRFDLEMTDFHIPMWIYSPGNIQPKRVKRLLSQIDLLPSLIHLLGLKDSSPFFGQSFYNENWTEERAFIGNYQYVGFYKDNLLTTLGPNRKVRRFTYDPKTHRQLDSLESKNADEAISYYQHASSLLTGQGYNLN